MIPCTLGLVQPDAVLPRRTLDVARELTHFVAETPKTTRRFLKEIDGGSPLRSVDIAELSEHTPRERVAVLGDRALIAMLARLPSAVERPNAA